MSGPVVFCGVFLVLLEALFAVFDEFFLPQQLRASGIEGNAFVEQGAMWADAFLITPLSAYLVGKYHFDYLSWRSGALFVIALVVSVSVAVSLTKSGEMDSSVHNGRITATGYLHIVFATLAFWVLLMFYFGPLDPVVSHQDLFLTSCVLMPFLFLGVVVFNKRWKFESRAKGIVTIEFVLIWTVAIIRLVW